MVEKIINKTPHSVYILGEDLSIVRMFPKSAGMIRVEELVTKTAPIDGVPTCSTAWGDTVDVPPYTQGVYYIVSQLVKTALPHRKDFLVPKDIVRDSEGGILGCKCLDRTL
jgi:hypothetical protein